MKLRSFFLFGLVLASAAYLGVSWMLYTRLATVLPACAGEYTENTPAFFSAEQFNPNLDLSPYFMPIYKTVSIPSRDPDITLNAWFVPADVPDAPAVLITHGLGVGVPDCKRHPRALLPAGMLHRAGYNVLLIDVRDHGDSTIEDGMWSANTEEHRDTLGAWDWLMNVRGFAPERIGLFGYSGGTGATLIAMGEEPRVAAVWLDSVYADIQTSIADSLIRNGFPTFLVPGGLLIARVHGDDLTAYSPLEAAKQVNGRPVFITHSDGDPALNIHYAYRLEAALRANGNNPTMWITDGSGHVTRMFDDPHSYEERLIAFFDDSIG
jgi:uncharacterized protein